LSPTVGRGARGVATKRHGHDGPKKGVDWKWMDGIIQEEEVKVWKRERELGR
jgi:hypothetical protein